MIDCIALLYGCQAAILSLRLRSYDLVTVENILRYSFERYADTVTGSEVAIGQHEKLLRRGYHPNVDGMGIVTYITIRKNHESEALLPQKIPDFTLASWQENNIKHLQTSLPQARGRLSSTEFYPSSFNAFGDSPMKLGALTPDQTVGRWIKSYNVRQYCK